MKIDHILVATDLSQEALACCAPVAGLARSMGARITLLHVLEGHAAIPHGAPLAPPVTEPAPAADTEEALARLEERRGAYGEGIEMKVEVVSGGDVAAAITDYAEKHAADLIAVATHGRTGFRHLVLGSVAEAVVRRSPLPVLVLPRPKR
jgi:nucleotide-binding universal stress UspA family protein